MLERCIRCRFLKDNNCIIYKENISQCIINNSYDKELIDKVEHYKVHPEMLPFVGINYGQKNKRILVVAESHYDKENKISPDNIKDWYSTRAADSYVWDVSTAQIRAEVIIGKEVRPTKIDNKLASAIYECLNKQLNINLANDKKAFAYIAYMNFFQRPVIGSSNSIINTTEDNQIANATFEAVVKILNPDYVLFISKKAWNTLCNKQRTDFVINRSCHPSSSWWNRKAYPTAASGNKITGREMFIDFLTTILKTN